MLSAYWRSYYRRLLHQYLKGQWTYNHRLPHKYLPGFSSDTGSDGRKRSTISSEPRWTRYLKWWKPQYSCAYPFHFWLRSSVQGRCQSLRWSHWWNKKRNKWWCWWSRLQPVTGPQEFFQRLQNLPKYKKSWNRLPKMTGIAKRSRDQNGFPVVKSISLERDIKITSCE